MLYPFYILGHVPNSMNVYVIWRDLTGFWHSSSLIFSGSFLHYHPRPVPPADYDKMMVKVHLKPKPMVYNEQYQGWDGGYGVALITVPFYKLYTPGTRVMLGINTRDPKRTGQRGVIVKTMVIDQSALSQGEHDKDYLVSLRDGTQYWENIVNLKIYKPKWKQKTLSKGRGLRYPMKEKFLDSGLTKRRILEGRQSSRAEKVTTGAAPPGANIHFAGDSFYTHSKAWSWDPVLKTFIQRQHANTSGQQKIPKVQWNSQGIPKHYAKSNRSVWAQKEHHLHSGYTKKQVLALTQDRDTQWQIQEARRESAMEDTLDRAEEKRDVAIVNAIARFDREEEKRNVIQPFAGPKTSTLHKQEILRQKASVTQKI